MHVVLRRCATLAKGTTVWQDHSNSESKSWSNDPSAVRRCIPLMSYLDLSPRELQIKARDIRDAIKTVVCKVGRPGGSSTC